MSEFEWLDSFGDNLALMLRDARMSQTELAEEAGLTRAAVSNYIHKRRIPNVRALINIAYVLGCSLDDLIDFGDRIED